MFYYSRVYVKRDVWFTQPTKRAHSFTIKIESLHANIARKLYGCVPPL